MRSPGDRRCGRRSAQGLRHGLGGGRLGSPLELRALEAERVSGGRSLRFEELSLSCLGAPSVHEGWRPESGPGTDFSLSLQGGPPEWGPRARPKEQTGKDAPEPFSKASLGNVGVRLSREELGADTPCGHCQYGVGTCAWPG